jgi:hypothetical protein
MRALLVVVGNVEDLDVNLWPAVIPQYKRVPIMEVEGAGKVTPSPVEVQVATIGDIGEHLLLPPG